MWDADAVRGDIPVVAVKRLGTTDAILVVDETGAVKKGVHTVGVQRQYTGTAGRIENAQVGVFLTCTTAAGHALIDRESYPNHEDGISDDRGRRAPAAREKVTSRAASDLHSWSDRLIRRPTCPRAASPGPYPLPRPARLRGRCPG
ncbi:transposase [Amycolatopsis sp. NPDC058278]|uniref:transposase n=1 Tax=Amycolatopsis sp. NPDC058278 TaxID=3346417 RepID=UPI0036D86FE6